MAGHSKWANIKHKKAREDSKRGKAFTKLIKEITVAARSGGGDPTGNPRLRTLLEKAREINMPQENTTRAVKKGTGELPGVNYESITYEGYGPHGIAVIVEALTDNKNRTVAAVRHIFSAKGGSLGETGSVNWMFERLGVIRAEGNKTEDEVLEALLDFEIRDVIIDGTMITITCEPKAVEVIKKAVLNLGLKIQSAEVEMIAKTPATLTEDQAQKAYAFLEELDDQDDVQSVYANLT